MLIESQGAGRPKKTPAEINAQVGRIARKLVQRADRVNTRSPIPVEGGIGIDTVDTVKDTTVLKVQTKRVEGSRTRAALEYAQNGEFNELSFSGLSEAGMNKVSVTFTDIGSTGEHNGVQLPAEANTGMAAKILMKVRGGIAEHEIQQQAVQHAAQQEASQTAQASANELLK